MQPEAHPSLPSQRWVKVELGAGWSGIITRLAAKMCIAPVSLTLQVSWIYDVSLLSQILDTSSLCDPTTPNRTARKTMQPESTKHMQVGIPSQTPSPVCTNISLFSPPVLLLPRHSYLSLKSSFSFSLLQMLEGPELIRVDHKSSQRLKGYFWILPYSLSFPDTEPIPA